MLKHIILLSSFIALIGLSSSTTPPCDQALKHKSKCVEQLEDGFVFVKTYILDAEKADENGEIEYSFVFSKGTSYMLTVSNENGSTEDIEVTLLNPNHKELVNNFNEKDNEYLPINFTCKATGIHYIKFKLKNKAKCGISVLGFKRG